MDPLFRRGGSDGSDGDGYPIVCTHCLDESSIFLFVDPRDTKPHMVVSEQGSGGSRSPNPKACPSSWMTTVSRSKIFEFVVASP